MICWKKNFGGRTPAPAVVLFVQLDHMLHGSTQIHGTAGAPKQNVVIYKN
jgi:hypothetical protein